MRTTLIRILKNGGLVAGVLLIIGAMFGQIAGMWVASQTPARVGLVQESGNAERVSNGDSLATSLHWKMPLAMAGWGFALVAGFELVTSILRQPKTVTASIAKPTADDAEEMVQQFLKDAEAKATNLADTPAPAKLPSRRESELVRS